MLIGLFLDLIYFNSFGVVPAKKTKLTEQQLPARIPGCIWPRSVENPVQAWLFRVVKKITNQIFIVYLAPQHQNPGQIGFFEKGVFCWKKNAYFWVNFFQDRHYLVLILSKFLLFHFLFHQGGQHLFFPVSRAIPKTI
jgi:hypothetical protein